MARVTARAAVMQMIFERLEGGQGGEDTLRMVYEQLREERPAGRFRPGGRAGGGRPGVHRAGVGGRALPPGRAGRADSVRQPPIGRSTGCPHVDLTILRLAVWEILHEDEVPGPVAINEAVTLAGCYSEPASGRFINGVLGTILRRKEGRA